MNKVVRKPPVGKKLPDTPDMKAWREEFEQMKTEDHLNKLKALGLDDDDLEEFKEMEEGTPLDEEIMQQGPVIKDNKKTTKKKPTVKK